MTRAFVLDTTERLIKTAVQAFLAYFTADAVDVLSADWKEAATITATAALISLLTSLGSMKLGVSGTASLTNVVEPRGRHAAP